ncbi:rRNA adenine N-6-methyltransferase family protein, partial [Serratia sp. OLFL2]
MSKEFGVFYTPQFLIDFIIDKISPKILKTKSVNVLEPSAGDGRFIDSLMKKKSQSSINASLVEINSKSAKSLNEKFINKKNIKVINHDFLYYENEHNFDIIIG